jgi:Ca2+-binding RTX toxin-like protein
MDYSHYTVAVNVNLQNLQASGLSGTFAAIEALSGSPQIDTFTGQNLPSTFSLDGSDQYVNAAITLGLSDFETLVGGSAADSFQVLVDAVCDLLGGGGNDTFILANAVMLTGSLDGGTGLDTLDLGSWASALTALLTAPSANGGFDGSVDGLSGGFASLDRLVGGPSPANSLTGLDADAVWRLNAVGDNSYASSGRTLYFINFDTLQGGNGADTVYLANGLLFDGSLDGGDGSDTLHYSLFTVPVNVDLGTGIVTGLTDLALDFENAVGGRANDNLIGDDLANILDGGPGDDILSGLGGDDTLITGTGHNNILYGGDGYDTGVIHYDAGFLVPLSDVENLILLKRPRSLPPPPPTGLVVSVLSGQRIDFSGLFVDYVQLRLPEGHGVLFGVLTCTLASLDALTTPVLLPGALEPGIAAVYGMQVNAWQAGQLIGRTGGAMLISFRIPDWMRGLELAILRWEPDSGTWIELDTLVSPDGRWAKAASRRTGIYLLVVRGLQGSLECTGQAVLALPDGARLSLPCGLADLASLAPLAAWQLPGHLPSGLGFASAARVWVLQEEMELSEADLDISFPIPDPYPAEDLVILHWQAGTWTALPTTAAGGRLEARGTRTGSYVLAVRSTMTSLACQTDTATADAGSAHVTASCGSSGELKLTPELAETLPGPLYEEDHFLAGVTIDLPSGAPFHLDFDLPGGAPPVQILRYDPELYGGAGGWVRVADGNGAEADQPGTYILVTH